MKAAKKRKTVSYGPELLLQVLVDSISKTLILFFSIVSFQGMSDSVVITLKS